MFGKYEMGDAEKVEINNRKVSALWTVKPFQVGTFTDGEYKVVIRYEGGGVMGETNPNLRIVAAGSNGRKNSRDLGIG
jgi:hypothetical protein